MGCQKVIAEKIIQGEGDYVLAVKDNLPLLRQVIEARFKASHESEFAEEKCRQHQIEEKHHGRIEKRFYYQSPISKKLKHLTATGPKPDRSGKSSRSLSATERK